MQAQSYSTGTVTGPAQAPADTDPASASACTAPCRAADRDAGTPNRTQRDHPRQPCRPHITHRRCDPCDHWQRTPGPDRRRSRRGDRGRAGGDRPRRRDVGRLGDRIGLVTDSRPGTESLGRIVRVDKRSTVLRRTADDDDPVERVIVANADQLAVVVATVDPEPRLGFIDRAFAGVMQFDAQTRFGCDLRDATPHGTRAHDADGWKNWLHMKVLFREGQR